MPRTALVQAHIAAASSILSGMQAYWKLDGLTDSHGANTLTNNNGVTFVAGKIGNAAQFASTKFLSIADNAALSMGDIDFLIAAWVNHDSFTGEVAIAGKWNTTNNREYLIEYQQTTQRYRFLVSPDGVDGTNAVLANSFGVPSTGTWNFVVAWHDAGANTINIQVNNGAVDSAAYSSGVFNGTASFLVGDINAGGVIPWIGKVDGLLVAKRLYSTAERTALYNYGLQGIEYPFPPRLPLVQARGALVQARVAVP